MAFSVEALENEALEHASVGLGIFDVCGDTIRQVYLNEGFYRMIGARREDRSQFRDTGTIESVHPDDRAGLLVEAKAAMREERLFKYRFRNLGGDGTTYVWIGITASHRPLDADTERFYATYSDINGYIDDQMRDKTSYERSLEDIITAVPGSAGIAHVDLTENTFTWTREPFAEFALETQQRTWDELVERVLEGVADETEREKLKKFSCTEMINAFRKGENRLSHSYQRRGEDGKPRWITSHAYILGNPENDHVECIAYTQDISTERQQSEIFRIITSRSCDLVALIHLDSRTFEAVFLGETLPAVYRALLPESGAVCDFDAFCAESASHMNGETKKDYQAKLSSDYIRGELDRSGGSYEFTMRLDFEGGGRAPVYRRLLHYRLTDDPDAVLVIESDVTTEIIQQQESTAKVLAQAERDRLIMDSIMGGICILKMDDSDHLSVEYFNSYVFEMLGYDPAGLPQTPEDAKGTPAEPLFVDALTFIHPDDKDYVVRMYHEHRDDKIFSLEPYRMFGSDGAPRWIKVEVRKGDVMANAHLFYVAMHDVTQELELQKELARQMEDERRLRREADAANAAKTDFLSRMSHDIRTPLNGVIGMAYLARQEENPPRTDECIEKIDTSAKFLLGLINDVLDMAKMESGKVELRPEPYPIAEFNEYLDAVIKPLCEEKGVHLTMQEDVMLDAWPLVDKNAINQILFNLLSNAVKFTPEGGIITYRIKGRQIAPNRAAIEHCIADTGIGMSEEFCQNLFEPFSQEGRDDVSENRGSGLGLSIVKKLVDVMGGTISVDSEFGRGTAFTVNLEFDTMSAQPEALNVEARNASDASVADLDGMHVLLCEDHPLNQEIAKAILEEKGAMVDIADNGRIGLEMFERSAPGFYDAILMDIRMPVMDGRDATRSIRALDRPDSKSVPIIAMTADAFDDDVRKCLEAGMNAHIAKPVDPLRLIDAVALSQKD